MPRFPAILAALVVACACSPAYAGDFVPRAASNFASVADDPGTRAACPDTVATAAASSDSDAVAPARTPAPAHSNPARNPRHVGVDDSGDVHPTSGGDGDASPAPHKAKGALRWQSLLPGVMK